MRRVDLDNREKLIIAPDQLARTKSVSFYLHTARGEVVHFSIGAVAAMDLVAQINAVIHEALK